MSHMRGKELHMEPNVITELRALRVREAVSFWESFTNLQSTKLPDLALCPQKSPGSRWSEAGAQMAGR